ncbi:hypothetical protein [Actinacidiphila glaucinigra]|uniref:Knr4/Smi1-like domain-containing protein n=1 Tax=Actinacidiphila glaucinigra TaxID=235986 RepID=A0A239MTE7_9ACTN|nr:hypothetical protein [Actinacidiphila glaucinigra]SNT46026.1 hypothetical protein SAMN05216252_12770 [Actinacidiphila glaucinigra]
MSIQRLEGAVSDLRQHRRAQPRGINWELVSQLLGTTLPSDYTELIDWYPDLIISDFIAITRPGPGREERFVDSQREELEDLRGFRDEGWTGGHEVFPTPGGLLRWGGSDEGDGFYWRTAGGTPDEWTVVVGSRNGHWADLHCGLTEYLARLLSGQAEPHGLPANIEEGGGTVDYEMDDDNR